MTKHLLHLKLLIPAIVLILVTTGCKKETASNQNFIGSYSGTLYVIDYYAPGVAATNEVYDTSQVVAETLIITSGATSSKVNLQLVNGGLNGTGTVSGNSLTLDQTSSGGYTTSGSASINGKNITGYINNNLTGNSHPYESQYLFKGTKQ